MQLIIHEYGPFPAQGPPGGYRFVSTLQGSPVPSKEGIDRLNTHNKEVVASERPRPC